MNFSLKSIAVTSTKLFVKGICKVIYFALVMLSYLIRNVLLTSVKTSNKAGKYNLRWLLTGAVSTLMGYIVHKVAVLLGSYAIIVTGKGLLSTFILMCGYFIIGWMWVAFIACFLCILYPAAEDVIHHYKRDRNVVSES